VRYSCTFNARFSTDLDIVVAPGSKADFVEFLEQQGFEETDSHAKEWFYDTEVIEYEKRLTPQQPIGFDLLVNGLGCRQTEAQWSSNYLYGHSHQQEVSGSTVTTTGRVIDGPLPVSFRVVVTITPKSRLEATLRLNFGLGRLCNRERTERA
jgi:hypothetical protein